MCVLFFVLANMHGNITPYSTSEVQTPREKCLCGSPNTPVNSFLMAAGSMALEWEITSGQSAIAAVRAVAHHPSRQHGYLLTAEWLAVHADPTYTHYLRKNKVLR